MRNHGDKLVPWPIFRVPPPAHYIAYTMAKRSHLKRFLTLAEWVSGAPQLPRFFIFQL